MMRWLFLFPFKAHLFLEQFDILSEVSNEDDLLLSLTRYTLVASRLYFVNIFIW